ncbi:MAG: hypothetical protein IJ013_00310, partial [Bacteroidaceae bacterium]|nr:hypothetical protein [Bacteroidaceae bacterium]
MNLEKEKQAPSKSILASPFFFSYLRIFSPACKTILPRQIKPFPRPVQKSRPAIPIATPSPPSPP